MNHQEATFNSKGRDEAYASLGKLKNNLETILDNKVLVQQVSQRLNKMNLSLAFGQWKHTYKQLVDCLIQQTEFSTRMMRQHVTLTDKDEETYKFLEQLIRNISACQENSMVAFAEKYYNISVMLSLKQLGHTLNKALKALNDELVSLQKNKNS